MTVNERERFSQLLEQHRTYRKMYAIGGLWWVPDIEFLIQLAKRTRGRKTTKSARRWLAKVTRLPLKEYTVWQHRRWVCCHALIDELFGYGR